MDDFIRIVKKHYPDKKISKAYTWNTLRVDGNIAKLLTWDIDDPDDIQRAKKAFEVERKIYSMLPSWWGIRLIDSFEDDNNFVIVTNELPNCKWLSFMERNRVSIIADIEKQLNWLHSNKILHDDLELKNILLSCDGKHATIIDFEKSKFNATPQEMKSERDHIMQRLNDELRNRRVRSRSAGRRRKRTMRKTKKRKY